jgi:hypothetical protein
MNRQTSGPGLGLGRCAGEGGAFGAATLALAEADALLEAVALAEAEAGALGRGAGIFRHTSGSALWSPPRGTARHTSGGLSSPQPTAIVATAEATKKRLRARMMSRARRP